MTATKRSGGGSFRDLRKRHLLLFEGHETAAPVLDRFEPKAKAGIFHWPPPEEK